MRILMIQPNYHSGGTEIAGNWPPSWVPYVGGALKTEGFSEVRFVDAMTNYIADGEITVNLLRAIAVGTDEHDRREIPCIKILRSPVSLSQR